MANSKPTTLGLVAWALVYAALSLAEFLIGWANSREEAQGPRGDDVKHLAMPVVIDRPGIDCSRPADERLCVCVSGCAHALTSRLGPTDYHYTRCAKDGGEIPIPAPPESGPRLIQKPAPVIPLRRSPFRMQLCKDPFAMLPPSPAGPRLARWKALVGRPRASRMPALLRWHRGAAVAKRTARSRHLHPVWRQGWICLKSECRYHLAEFGGTPMASGCALIIATAGPKTFAQIGELSGCSRQNIEQVLSRAMKRSGLDRLREFAPEHAGTDRRSLTRAERIMRLLSAGSAMTVELAEASGLDADSLRPVLRQLEAEGKVCGDSIGYAGIEWTMVDPAQRLAAAEES